MYYRLSGMMTHSTCSGGNSQAVVVYNIWRSIRQLYFFSYFVSLYAVKANMLFSKPSTSAYDNQ